MARFAVLNVYFTDPVGCTTVASDTFDLVASLVALALIDDPELACIDDISPWPCLQGRPRELVPVAVGILTAALGIGPVAALAVSRSRASNGNQTVDDAAADLVNG